MKSNEVPGFRFTLMESISVKCDPFWFLGSVGYIHIGLGAGRKRPGIFFKCSPSLIATVVEFALMSGNADGPQTE